MKVSGIIIRHRKPVYFSSLYGGFFVVHYDDKRSNTITIGKCCRFYNDAYTCILRYKVDRSILDDMVLVNKRRLSTVCFTSIDRWIGRLAVHPQFPNLTHLWSQSDRIIKEWIVE